MNDDVDTPLRLLMETGRPREVSEDVARGAERLHAYRSEVNAELKKARRHAPRFSSPHPERRALRLPLAGGIMIALGERCSRCHRHAPAA